MWVCAWVGMIVGHACKVLPLVLVCCWQSITRTLKCGVTIHSTSHLLELLNSGTVAFRRFIPAVRPAPPTPQIKRSMQLPKLSSPPPDFLTSMEAYVAEAPRPVAADGEVPAPAKVGLRAGA